jgi:hypothetical protein
MPRETILFGGQLQIEVLRPNLRKRTFLASKAVIFGVNPTGPHILVVKSLGNIHMRARASPKTKPKFGDLNAEITSTKCKKSKSNTVYTPSTLTLDVSRPECSQSQ